VGVPEGKLVLGKHSGRHALNKRCEDLGYQLTREELNVVYERFTAAADRKKGLTDREIAALVDDTLAQRSAAAD
jgi:2-isopropylmalate synthase